MKKAAVFFTIFFTISIFIAGLHDAFSAEQQVLSLNLDPKEIISMEELRDLQVKKTTIVLYDARSLDAYGVGHIEGATLPMPPIYYQEKKLLAAGVISKPFDYSDSLVEAMKGRPKDTMIVTYCNSNCKASANLLRQLQRLGFNNVRSMEEGYQSWEKAGYPVSKPVKPAAEASAPLE